MHPRIPYRRTPILVDEALANLESEIELAQSRRSIREFSEKPVDRRLIEAALQIAITAPSGANQQPYRFVVIASADLRARIREEAEAEERRFYHGRAPEAWLSALSHLETDENKPYLSTVPYIIVVFRQVTGSKGEKLYYPMESVGIAVGFLIAALHRFGLSTLTHTPAPMGFLNVLCERPPNEKPFMLLPVGYPADDVTVPDISRLSLEACVTWK